MVLKENLPIYAQTYGKRREESLAAVKTKIENLKNLRKNLDKEDFENIRIKLPDINMMDEVLMKKINTLYRTPKKDYSTVNTLFNYCYEYLYFLAAYNEDLKKYVEGFSDLEVLKSFMHEEANGELDMREKDMLQATMNPYMDEINVLIHITQKMLKIFGKTEILTETGMEDLETIKKRLTHG